MNQDAEPKAPAKSLVPATPTSTKGMWIASGVISIVAIAVGLAAVLVRTEQPQSELAATREKAVQTSKAIQKTIPLHAEYRGEIVTEVAEIASRAVGRIIQVQKQLGEEVKKGDLLALIDVTETQRLLGEAKAQDHAATAIEKRSKAQLQAAQVEYERGKALNRESLLSAQEVAQLAAQVAILEAEIESAAAQRKASSARVSIYQNQIQEGRLTAPFDGAVAERYLDPGSSVNVGTPLLRLVKTESLKVRFRASEQHIRHIKKDSTFQLSTPATQGLKIEGRVTHIGAEVSRTDRSVAVEGVILEHADKLKPGMYAVIVLELGTIKDAILVPSSAIMTRLDPKGLPSFGVMAVREGRAHFQPVDVLGEHQERTAVEGVANGATVITFGQDFVVEGARVREIIAEGPDLSEAE